jgi:DNA-binding transcriptional LysR family regulator
MELHNLYELLYKNVEHGRKLMTFAIEWEWYRAFLGVLREGSLSGAARTLGVAQPTVGRHVAALEAALGLVLFTRSQTGLLPTDAARALRADAEAMESVATALARTASGLRGGGEVAGTVRVSVSEVVGVEVMPAILATLAARHPALTVELVLSNRVQDLLQREADIAVRMTPPRQAQLVARRVATIDLGLHATPDYLARRGMPASLDALAAHTLIGYDRPSAFARAAAKTLPWLARLPFALRTDSDVAQLALIRAGAGIGICQVPLAARAPALVRVLPDAFVFPLETWVTMHEDLRASPRCRAVFDALAAGLATYAGGA